MASKPLSLAARSSARLTGLKGVFDRRLDGRVLEFEPAGPNHFRDRVTGPEGRVVQDQESGVHPGGGPLGAIRAAAALVLGGASMEREPGESAVDPPTDRQPFARLHVYKRLGGGNSRGQGIRLPFPIWHRRVL